MRENRYLEAITESAEIQIRDLTLVDKANLHYGNQEEYIREIENLQKIIDAVEYQLKFGEQEKDIKIYFKYKYEPLIHETLSLVFALKR